MEKLEKYIDQRLNIAIEQVIKYAMTIVHSAMPVETQYKRQQTILPNKYGKRGYKSSP